MNKTILILAIIAVLLIAYVAMKSEKTTIERTPVVSDTAVVQASGSDNIPMPDAAEEIIIVDEEMPDPQDISVVDEEVIPAQGETVSEEAEVIAIQ